MDTTNSIQALLGNMADVIRGATHSDSLLDRAFGTLISFDLILWLFLPLMFFLVLWQVAIMASRLGRLSTAVTRLTAVLGDAAHEHTTALHHFRDKTQTSLQGLQAATDKQREGIQQAARDTVKALEIFDRHVQTGADEIRKPLANLYDRLGKVMALQSNPDDESDRDKNLADMP